ncbi:MAG: HNH endonuclease [Anaerolineaceae bacterium]|nr:HNH endonuclease [Anaerolineaceae bacterium]
MNELSWNTLRRLVYERANGCCEYCLTSEANSGQTMHVDHIDPHGDDMLDNLCLACWNCNTSKQQSITATDPETQQTVSLFNPRTDQWSAHFKWLDDGVILQGSTPVGRATVERLKMNRPAIMIARKRWVDGGYHPPDRLL